MSKLRFLRRLYLRWRYGRDVLYITQDNEDFIYQHLTYIKQGEYGVFRLDYETKRILCELTVIEKSKRNSFIISRHHMEASFILDYYYHIRFENGGIVYYEVGKRTVPFCTYVLIKMFGNLPQCIYIKQI